MSSKLSGCISRSSERIGPPSNWKTPRVSPRAEQVVGRRGRSRSLLSASRSIVLAAVGLDVAQRVVEDREVAQAEEVHLDQAERLAARVVELGDDLAVLLAAHDRDDVDQRLAGHDHAGRVHAPLPLQALEPARGLDDLAGAWGRLVVDLAELPGLAVALVARVEDARRAGCPCP